MIQAIDLKNFKSIKTKFFPLRKLNVLLGLNGMGKSSFIQSLLLMRQSDKLGRGELQLQKPSGAYVNIGTTKDVRYQYSQKGEDVSIGLQFSGMKMHDMNFDYEIESDILKIKGAKDDYINSYVIANSKQPLFSENFQYLNANRIPPKASNIKSYTSVVRLKNIGNFGEYTAHFIETFYNDEIEFDNLLHKGSFVKDELLGTEIANKTLINQINLWMGEISPGVNVKTTSISNEEVLLEYVFKQPNFGNTNRFTPENVGFGISYSLHVVTALLASRPGELIIIENPESHVHPRGQAEIGKLIALAAMNDVQVIIETHSDHVVNGIRVAVKNHQELVDNTILFYFEKEITSREQYSIVKNITIDSNGELSEYPSQLLREWSNQLLNLI